MDPDELIAVAERLEALVARAESSSMDATQLASQLGRFDLASLLLAIVSIALILGGLFAFGFIQGQVAGIAKKTAEDIAEERLKNLLNVVNERLDAIQKTGTRRQQPTSKPSTEGAQAARADTEIT